MAARQQCAEPGDDGRAHLGSQGGEGSLEALSVEHLPIPGAKGVGGLREPDQGASRVPGVAHPLEKPLGTKTRYDVADYRLGPLEMGRHLPDGERPAHGQVFEHGPALGRD